MTSTLVSITPWNQGWPYGPVGPGASNWIGRCDGRITGGWLANGTLGFMWTANKQDPWDGRDSREATFIEKLKAAAPRSEIANLDPIVNALRAAPPIPHREGKKRPFIDTW